MKQTRFTEAQVVGILQEADAQGAAVREVCSRHGVCEQTFYRWRRRYRAMQVDEVKRLRELEAENARLKRLLGDALHLRDDRREAAPVVRVVLPGGDACVFHRVLRVASPEGSAG
jgi:putative transposase